MARRELVVALVSDSSQFNRGFDQAEGKVKSFGKEADRAASGGVGKLDSKVSAFRASLGGLAVGIGAVALGSKLKGFADESVQAFSDLNESVNAVNVTFGDAADGILRLGKNSAQSVGLANAQFNSLAVGFSAFADNIAGASGQNVVDVMDDLTTRIADFASVMNLDVAEAADKFRSGLAGETEPLRKFGLDVSAAAVNLKALELGLGGAGGELSEGDKVLARYQLIMDQTNKTAGDFQNTIDNLANAQRVATAEAENLSAVIGEQLAPEYAKMITLGADLKRSAAVLALGFLADTSTAAGEARKELAILSIQMGETADSAAALATAVTQLGSEDFMGESDMGFGNDRAEVIRELARQSGIAGEELQKLAGNLDYLQDNFGLSAADAAVLADELAKMQREANAAVADVVLLANAHGTLDGAVSPVSAAVREAATAYSESRSDAMRLRDSLRGLADAQRAATDAFLAAADPAFAAAAAMGRLRDAEASLDEVRGDAEASATDLAEAELAVAEARLRTQDALNNLDEASLIRVFDTLAEAMDGSTDDARELLEALGLLDGLEVTTVVNTKFTTTGAPPSGSIAGGDLIPRASGGPVSKGSNYLVGEEGPELFVPNQNGTIVPNGGMGATTNLTQNFYQLPGGNLSEDINRGLLVAGLSRLSETAGV